MQKLLVYQSLWAMERRRPDGLEWSLPEKLQMIRDAGFDGAGVRFFDYKYAKEVTDFLRANNMTWQAQCYPKTIDDLASFLAGKILNALGFDQQLFPPWQGESRSRSDRPA